MTKSKSSTQTIVQRQQRGFVRSLKPRKVCLYSEVKSAMQQSFKISSLQASQVSYKLRFLSIRYSYLPDHAIAVVSSKILHINLRMCIQCISAWPFLLPSKGLGTRLVEDVSLHTYHTYKLTHRYSDFLII